MTTTTAGPRYCVPTLPSNRIRTTPNYDPTRAGCSWLSEEAAELIRIGEPAFLRICVMRKRKGLPDRPHVEIYMVNFDAETRTWRLTRDDKGDGSGAGFKTYHVDAYSLDCDCEDANYHACKGKHECKHAKSLRLGLPAIGIEVMTGK